MGWNDTKHNRGASPRPFLGSIFFRVHGCSVMFGQCWLVFLIEKQLWNQTELESNLDIFGLFWGSFSPPPPHPMFEKKTKTILVPQISFAFWWMFCGSQALCLRLLRKFHIKTTNGGLLGTKDWIYYRMNHVPNDPKCIQIFIYFIQKKTGTP